MIFRVLVSGSRDFPDPATITGCLDDLLAIHGHDLVVVHGHCPDGADHIADLWALAKGLTPERHPARWDLHGRKAGPIRNGFMVDTRPDLLLAFRHNQSPGTSDCVAKARRARIPSVVFDTYSPEIVTPPS